MSATDHSTMTARINIHHHMMPPSLVGSLKKAGLGHSLSLAWTPQQSIDDMAASGIATSVLSLTLPAVAFLARDDARRAARESNDYAMTLNSDHPGRFGAFATLPMPYVEESLAELDYAFDTLRMDGVCVLTSYGGKWLGDACFWPIMDALNRRRAVLFVHPNLPACCARLDNHVPPPVVEYGTDTARAIANLICTKTAMRCPDIRFVFTHAGGAMPMFIDRLTSLWRSGGEFAELTSERVMAELRRFHYDTALAANAPAMAAISRVAPITQLLLGTDFPLRPSDYQVRDLATLFDARELRAIERDNALRLLPRLGPV
jgi:predicted TIM-barrel fold metal-dependent hydrolase